jgi:cytochrome c biogenesis protein CcmG/thiol:disulfide interchange protein DsbE
MADQETTEAPARRTAPWIAGSVAVVLVAFIALLATRKQGDDGMTSALIDKAVPITVGKTLDGQSFDINDHKGQWVLVNFFSTTCGPCITEHPELTKWFNNHQGSGDATLVSVVFNESADSVKKYFAEKGGGWPVLGNEDGSISSAYGVVKLPESYLIDTTGVVRVKYLGAVTEDELNRRIASYRGS